MNINETELREDLGTFGGAVTNGWLKPNFQVEEVVIDVYNGEPCLKCHMGRWFGRDDDIILLPNGTGINTDPNAKNDKTFKWKSIRALHTSFTRAILIGAGIGAATGAGVGAIGGHLGWWGAAAKGAANVTTANAAATTAAGAATKKAAGAATKKAARATTKKTAGAATKKAAGYGIVGGNTPSYSSNSSIGGKVVTEEQINEVVHALVGGAVGAVGGALVGGITALVKNRDDVMYYSDGSYVSRKGTVEGRWDGSVEEEAAKKEGGEQDGRKTTPTPPVNRILPEIPGMPANFGSNPENVKIAQRYLVANHANISTSKSIDGIDGKLGPRTRRAILAYMNQHSCDFNKFWQDAQEYNTTKQNVDNFRGQNLQTQIQQTQNLKLNAPEPAYQKPQQTAPTIKEVRGRFFDMLNRINNATILQ